MHDFQKTLINSTLSKVLKRLHYPLEVMLTCVRWYVAYPLSLRHIEELMQERGVFVDHATVHRWAIKMMPVLAAVLDRKSTRLNSSHGYISYAVFCLKKKTKTDAIESVVPHDY